MVSLHLETRNGRHGEIDTEYNDDWLTISSLLRCTVIVWLAVPTNPMEMRFPESRTIQALASLLLSSIHRFIIDPSKGPDRSRSLSIGHRPSFLAKLELEARKYGASGEMSV